MVHTAPGPFPGYQGEKIKEKSFFVVKLNVGWRDSVLLTVIALSCMNPSIYFSCYSPFYHFSFGNIFLEYMSIIPAFV